MNEPKFAKHFYKSGSWAKCRKAYIQNVGGLCERCFAEGRIVPGAEVHHKIRLTPENINDPSIALSFDNLELLCLEHHHQEHRPTRWRSDPTGRIDLDAIE